MPAARGGRYADRIPDDFNPLGAPDLPPMVDTRPPTEQLYSIAEREVPGLVADLHEALDDLAAAVGDRALRSALRDLEVEGLAKRACVVALEVYGTPSYAARTAGVSAAQFYAWQKDDPEFRRLCWLAGQAMADRLEARQYARALSPYAVLDKAAADITKTMLKKLRPLQYRESAPYIHASVPSASLDMGDINPYASAMPEGKPPLLIEGASHEAS